MRHHGLGCQGTIPIAKALVVSISVGVVERRILVEEEMVFGKKRTREVRGRGAASGKMLL